MRAERPRGLCQQLLLRVLSCLIPHPATRTKMDSSSSWVENRAKASLSMCVCVLGVLRHVLCEA